MKIMISGAAVLTMEQGSALIPDGEIIIEGQYITHVGPAGSVSPEQNFDRVIDARGMLAMPGFVNCHTHASMTLLRGYADDLPLMEWLQKKIWPVEERLEPEDIYWGAMLSCLEMIRSGTTTFADMYFHMDEVARAVEKAGMRASLSQGLIGLSPGAGEALSNSRRFIREWHGQAEGRITTMLGPHAPYTCPPDFLARVLDMADELKVGIHIHIAETRAEIEEIQQKYGKTPVALMEQVGLFNFPVLAAHCVHLTDEDIRILVARGAGIAHNPESNMKLASGIAPVTRLLAAGALVGLGTDGAASNNNLDMMEEMRSAALLQKVATMDPMALPAQDALAMATVNGARVLGLKDVGPLKPGNKADIILVNLDRPHFYPRHNLMAHLVYAARASDVETVIIDGRLVMENRQVLTLDEERIYYEVQKRAEKLVGAVRS
ncbi:5-methylthioadenosine/S-adenosylhomocysteine deaminase [Desulfofundulus australicus DSM 11792]|uniref:5-methylthioadenosine/S-adenosylhomocysteine deaminase n=2 Tax=Peptococcaceae TaxID=186807 RepID=A0A1M4U953_9FIRM|nr:MULTISPECIES: amidohydrolase [Desulfofundulus]MBE3585173.1 amidohydrolase [Thermoanaerobacter sp.]MCS5696015.1 amidohydrolase [Desulfofundulus thermocisternus]SHE53178.1 5-methylthioadenosine/S-adenosylhomocysteine deaminase [Desulfofundulus australicus DSM 11792]